MKRKIGKFVQVKARIIFADYVWITEQAEKEGITITMKVRSLVHRYLAQTPISSPVEGL